MIETSKSFDHLLNDDPVDPDNQSGSVGDGLQGDPIVVEPDETPGVPPAEEDVFTTFLKEYGLKDGRTIVYQNDEGTEEEVDFTTLDREEQLNVLKELTSPGLSEDEVETINYLRKNNATIQDVAEYYKQKGVEEYIANNGEIKRVYAIDDYDDDTLYILDAKTKFPEMTDDELMSDLELAKTNEDLYKKKVETIRNQYKVQQDKEAEDAKVAQQEQYNNYKNIVQNSLGQFNAISLDYQDKESASLLIDEAEKNKIMSYVATLDENGYSQFEKDIINDPNLMVELAWYKLFGKDAISGISQFWKKELKEARKTTSTPKVEKKEPHVVIEPKSDPDPKKDKTMADLHKRLL